MHYTPLLRNHVRHTDTLWLSTVSSVKKYVYAFYVLITWTLVLLSVCLYHYHVLLSSAILCTLASLVLFYFVLMSVLFSLTVRSLRQAARKPQPFSKNIRNRVLAEVVCGITYTPWVAWLFRAVCDETPERAAAQTITLLGLHTLK